LGILDALGATGELIVVDRQIFEPPNVIIYSLGTGPDAPLGYQRSTSSRQQFTYTCR